MEFWITDSGEILYADGDIGEYGHAALAMQSALGVDLSSAPFDFIPMEPFNKDQLKWLREQQANKKAVKFLRDGSDPRDYAIYEMGWIRVLGTNIQMYEFTDEALRRIGDFLYDEIESGSYDEEDKIYIEDKDGDFYVTAKRLIDSKSASSLRRYATGLGAYRDD